MAGVEITAQWAREELYETIRGDASFDRKARDALKLDVAYLNVDNGHLTRIDRETDHWEATVSTDSASGRFPPGLELDLGTAYCRRTIESRSPIILHDAPSQGWADDPAFETHGLHCYHGTRILLDDEPYGTVCFVAEDPRPEEFSESETMFTELIAQLLERELEREQHEAELTRQANLASVLNRVLRHNLRNDMSVIRGYTRMMADQLDTDSNGDTVLRHIDRLISLSRKARELNRITSVDLEREPTEIVGFVERVVETVADEYPSALITVTYDQEITVDVLSSLTRALEELVENAAKHSRPDPTVTVAVETVPNAVEIQIMDDGPGLADHEAAVLEKGSETPLIHGSGLGLWLAHWIVSSHDGSVDATATEEGTTMTISIPRKPTSSAQQRLTKLTQVRDQYQRAFEEASEGMVIVNDDAHIVDANSQVAGTYGVDREELLGRFLSEFLPDGLGLEALTEKVQHADSEYVTGTVIRADGVERRIEYSITTDIVPGQHLVVSRSRPERARGTGNWK
ncbi:ATP-binding protein [Halobellus sp. GM3]|uniref:ATP-binding protein n=1 Tax=Halobellus sp. GM3 TaxID=3458410 RepID=UPI00403DF258